MNDDDVEVYEKHADELIRFAAALVGPSGAEDVVSSTVVNVFTSPAWASVTNRRAYLYRAVLHEAHRTRRASQRRLARETQAAPTVSVDPSTVDRDVLEALRRLSVRQRAVVYLRYWLDLSPSDVADVLEISLRTVERELTKARSRLEVLLS